MVFFVRVWFREYFRVSYFICRFRVMVGILRYFWGFVCEVFFCVMYFYIRVRGGIMRFYFFVPEVWLWFFLFLGLSIDFCGGL